MPLSCGIIYGMLINIAVNGLENAIRKEIPAHKRINGNLPKVNIVRFGSAIIVTGINIDILNKVKLIIENFLISRSLAGLELIKTRIVTIYEGFNFVGFSFERKIFNPRLNSATKQDTVLIIKPSNKAIKSLKIKVKKIILKHKTEIAGIIKEINPVLRE
jgi:RNA-directed DNA polymerase